MFSFKKIGKGVFALLILVVVLFLGGVLTVVAYKQYPSLFSRWIKPESPNANAQKEATSLVAEVGKYVDLPSDEVPTVATVSDAEKLKSQPFFAKAQNGDRVLFFTNAKKAYLYRPSTKKVLDIAPLSVGQSTEVGDSASPKPSVNAAPIKVSLLNGTTTVGLTNTAETKLKAIDGVTVTKKANATSTDYTRTIVVNVTNVKADVIAKIAQTVGGTVETLPAGEAKPDADVVIILAK